MIRLLQARVLDLRPKEGRFQFALGHRGTGAPPHLHGHAMNVVTAGVKLWELLPPKRAESGLGTVAVFFTMLFSRPGVAESPGAPLLAKDRPDRSQTFLYVFDILNFRRAIIPNAHFSS